MSDDQAIPSDELMPPDAPSSRVPHLGHALLFFAIAGVLLLVFQAMLLLPKMPAGSSPVAVSLQHPKLLLAAEAATYTITFLIAWFVFPLLWKRSFPAGVAWNADAAHGNLGKLIPLGLCTGWLVQGISSLISMPKSIPMDSFFRSASDVWLVTLFGTLLGPLFEEVCFRGFLLPACAIAFDWLAPAFNFSLQRLRGDRPSPHTAVFRESSSAGLAEGTGNLAFRSLPAIVVSSILTSVISPCFTPSNSAIPGPPCSSSRGLPRLDRRPSPHPLGRLLYPGARQLQLLRLPDAVPRHRRLPASRPHGPLTRRWIEWCHASRQPHRPAPPHRNAFLQAR